MASPLANKLIDYFGEVGCKMPKLGLLQPAEPFLDTAGEELRRRIFITTDMAGGNLCLRPEFTIPASLYHLNAGNSADRYAYLGPVFRQQRLLDKNQTTGPQEFVQAGIEDFGNRDFASADGAIVTQALEALRLTGLDAFEITMGDQSIFEAVLNGLELPEIWLKRFVRGFGDDELLKHYFAKLTDGNEPSETNEFSNDKELQQLLNDGNRNGLATYIAQAMKEAGLPQSGGRTADEIVCRLVQKYELANTRLSEEKRKILQDWLDIDVDLRDAVSKLRETEEKTGIKLGQSLEQLEARLAAMDTSGIEARFKSSFGRRLDYYTGLVFEIKTLGHTKPLAGGGRYNKLLSMLGAKEQVPAVGFAIWIDRIEAAIDGVAK